MKRQYLKRVIEWATSLDDVRAVAMVGSAARTDHPADEWSDYDLVIAVSDPLAYLSEKDWISRLGEAWVNILDGRPSAELAEIRVLFAGGYDFDFIFVSLENARQGFQKTPMVPEIMQRGVKVLLDKDNLLSAAPALAAPAQVGPARPSQPPSGEEFLAVVNDFWFHTAWTAKKLRRGETWVAKSCCDQYLKSLLLRMVEWEARSVRGWELDTWFNGRFLEDWAQPETLDELHQAFASYDTEDIWRALEATMKLFRRIAREVAQQLGYTYPADSDDRVSEWIYLTHKEFLREQTQ